MKIIISLSLTITKYLLQARLLLSIIIKHRTEIKLHQLQHINIFLRSVH